MPDLAVYASVTRAKLGGRRMIQVNLGIKKSKRAGWAIAIGLVASIMTVTPVEAHDGSATNCVTKHEWRHVKAGMFKARVHEILDTRGKFVDGFAGGYTHRYRPCAWNGGTDVRLYVSYDGYTRRVAEKRLV